MNASDFFNLPKSLSIFSYFFPIGDDPWTWLPSIEKALLAHQNFELKREKGAFFKGIKNFFLRSNILRIGKNVHLGKNVKLPVTCTIEDNVYIGDGTEIRSGALIRKNVIIGENCVIGNSCEIKNSLLMDNVQIAHFNYVGDSILGSRAHLSAGALLSNLRFDEQPVSINTGEKKIATGLRKFGAILGERVQVGCNSVILPGTLIGKNSIISVGTIFGGILGENKIVYGEAKNIVIARK
jgi:NDP-sugar pyrophosphorylase family protein